MIIRIDPPLWLNTPRGHALAHFLIAETEMDLAWVCFQQDTGECWTWGNKDIRAVDNITIGRVAVSSDAPVPKTSDDTPPLLPR